MLEDGNGYKFSFKRYQKQDLKTGPKQTPRFVSIQFDKNKTNKSKNSPAIQSDQKKYQFNQNASIKHRENDEPFKQEQSNSKRHFSSLIQEVQSTSDPKTKKSVNQLIRANSAEKIIQESNYLIGKTNKEDNTHFRSKTSEKKVRHPMSNRILQKMFPTMKKENEIKTKIKDNTSDSKQYIATIQKISEIKRQNLQLKKNLFKKPSKDKMSLLMQQWTEKEENKSKIQSIVYPLSFSKTKSKISKSTKTIRNTIDDIDRNIKDNHSVSSTSSLRHDTKNIYTHKHLRKKTDRSSRTDIINPYFLPSATNDISHTHLSSFNEFKNITQKKNLIPQLILQSELLEEDNKTKLSLRSGVKLLKKPHKNLKITKIEQDYNKKINEILNKLHGMSVKTQAQIPQQINL